MEYNVLDALAMITREKNLDRAIVIESLVAGLQSAAKKKLGANTIIDARVDGDTGEMTVEQVKTVVEEIEDPETDISLEEARLEFGDDVSPGDEVRWELPLDQFGRNAILVAKQILVQKVREAERSQIYEEYKDRVNTIVSGNVQQIDRGNALVNLDGRVEALMPYREQIRGEKLTQGRTVRCFIIEVLDNAKGPQVILSRSHPGFLKSLFEQEVPEIQERIVEIKAVAREPGSRSKIAVLSHDDRVDAVGSCVGMKGSRVQAVTRELNGERIDIVLWSPDAATLIQRALSPAEVGQIALRSERGEATVVVNEDQLSKAIGKEGKNVRLAAKLTEWKIDLVSTREYNVRQRVTQDISMELEEMTGVTPRIRDLLAGVGITSIRELAEAATERLLAIPGIGPKTAESLKATARATLEELQRMIEEAVQEELVQERPLFDESLLGEGAAAEQEPEAAEGPEAQPEVETVTDPFAGYEESVRVDPEEGGTGPAAEGEEDESGEADEEEEPASPSPDEESPARSAEDLFDEDKLRSGEE